MCVNSEALVNPWEIITVEPNVLNIIVQCCENQEYLMIAKNGLQKVVCSCFFLLRPRTKRCNPDDTMHALNFLSRERVKDQ